jgi:protein gp37
MGNPKYQTNGDPRTSGPGFGVAIHEDTLDLPRRWTSPRVVFVNSMSDLFHARVPGVFIGRVFDVMAATPRHTYQLLTKRPLRLARMARSLPWPENVWVGVSVENQQATWRLEPLRTVPAAVRFVSAEPLIGPVKLGLDGIDWLIAGGESGYHARPMRAEWVRSLRADCEAAGTAFFFKQWGGRTPKAGGRSLDGRTWDAMPNPVPRWDPQCGRNQGGAITKSSTSPVPLHEVLPSL